MPNVVAEPKNLHEISFNQRQRDLKDMERIEEEQIKQERKSPFSKFYQVNKEHSEELMWLLNKNTNAYKVLLFIFDHMDKYNAVMCSYSVLQEYFHLSRATLSAAIKVLKNNGFLYVYKSGTSNVYVANPNIVWNSWGNNKEYCEFPANIVLSKSEQEERANILEKRVQTVTLKEQ